MFKSAMITLKKVKIWRFEFQVRILSILIFCSIFGFKFRLSSLNLVYKYGHSLSSKGRSWIKKREKSKVCLKTSKGQKHWKRRGGKTKEKLCECGKNREDRVKKMSEKRVEKGSEIGEKWVGKSKNKHSSFWDPLLFSISNFFLFFGWNFESDYEFGGQKILVEAFICFPTQGKILSYFVSIVTLLLIWFGPMDECFILVPSLCR